jgi:oxalate decarboxylase/phosphoglucose isomerase-like protein (cupin superfamily)
MSDKLTFIEPADTETQVFDWGRLNWLSEPGVTAAERFSAGVVRLEPGKGHDRHNHSSSEEILYVISGKGLQMVEFTDGSQVEKEIGAGTMVHIPTALFHSTINTGDDTMELLAIYAPFGPEAELRKLEGVQLEPPTRSRD